MEIAGSHDVTVRLHCHVGAFVTRGDALATVWPGNLDQDIEFGIDQLVHVAIRGSSPERNDIFTIMLCLDRLGAALEYIGRAQSGSIAMATLAWSPCRRPSQNWWIMRSGKFTRSATKPPSWQFGCSGLSTRSLRRVRRDEDREALWRHALAVHRESRNNVQDTLGIDEIDRAFEETIQAIEAPCSLAAPSCRPRALQS